MFNVCYSSVKYEVFYSMETTTNVIDYCHIVKSKIVTTYHRKCVTFLPFNENEETSFRLAYKGGTT